MMLLKDKCIGITYTGCFEVFSFSLILALVTGESSVISSFPMVTLGLFFLLCSLGTQMRGKSHVYLLKSSH